MMLYENEIFLPAPAMESNSKTEESEAEYEWVSNLYCLNEKFSKLSKIQCHPVMLIETILKIWHIICSFKVPAFLKSS